MLFVFRYFPLADMSQTIVLIVLTVVESHLFAINGDAHRDETVDESLLDEDTRQHRAEDTACTVRREHVEGIVDAGVRTPIDGDVTDQRDDEGNKDALPHGDITSRGRDGNPATKGPLPAAQREC